MSPTFPARCEHSGQDSPGRRTGRGWHLSGSGSGMTPAPPLPVLTSPTASEGLAFPRPQDRDWCEVETGVRAAQSAARQTLSGSDSSLDRLHRGMSVRQGLSVALRGHGTGPVLPWPLWWLAPGSSRPGSPARPGASCGSHPGLPHLMGPGWSTVWPPSLCLPTASAQAGELCV